MRNAAFPIALLAILLFQDSPSFGQGVTSFKCPSTATLSGEEEALRAATKKYLTALKAKDWDAILKLSVTSLMAKPPESNAPYITILQTNQFFLTTFKQTQDLMQDLLQPFEIEELSFDIREVSGTPCQVSVHYSLNLRAVDPATRKLAIAVTGLRRVVLWQRFECECPPGNITEWKISQDVAEVGDMTKALAAAQTTPEQRLLLLGQTNGDLEKLAATLKGQGYNIPAQERASEAFAMFRLSQIVLGHVKYRERLEKLMKLRELESALAKARKAEDTAAEAETLYAMGSLYLDLRQFEQGIKFLEESLNKVGEADASTLVYQTIGKVYMEKGDYRRATSYYLKSLEGFKAVARRVGPDDARFMTDFFVFLRDLAFVYEEQGQGELAEKSLREILNWIEKGGQAEALFLQAIGIFHEGNGNVSKAIEYFEESTKVAKQLKKMDEDDELEYRQAFIVGTASLSLISLYLEQSDYINAAKNLIQARYGWKGDEAKGEEDSDEEENEEDEEEEKSDYIFPLYESLFYGSQGDAPLGEARSKRIMEDMLNLRREEIKQGDASLDLIDLIDLAVGEQLSRGNFRAAHERYSLLLKLAEETGDEFLSAQTYQRLATIYLHEKEYRPALESIKKSLQVLERMKLPPDMSLIKLEGEIAIARAGVGLIHLAMEEYDQALDSYLKIFERKSGGLYKKNGIDILHITAGLYFQQGRYDKALSTESEALALAQSIGKREDLWAIHGLIGAIHHARKEYKLAANSLKLAIREIEAKRYEVIGGERTTERFFEDKLSSYHEMIAMLVEQNRCHEALGYAERSKSRTLLDVLKRGKKDISRAVTDQERKREQTLRGIMVAAERKFDLTQAEYSDSPMLEDIKEERAKARMDFDAFRARLMLKYSKPDGSPKELAGVINPAQIGELLPSTDSALLEFAVTPDKTYLFILTREKSSVVAGHRRKPSSGVRCEVRNIDVKADDLIQPVKDFTLRIAHPNGIVKPLARNLYDLLLKPAQGTLAGKRTLVIVPDRILWTLPFQALQPDDDRYLLQESAIYYAPSFTSLREMKKTQARRAAKSVSAPKASTATPARAMSGNPTLLVMANPTLSSERLDRAKGVSRADIFPPLPMTEEQAPKLAQLYGPARSKVYVRAEADEDRFKKEAQGFDVIHIGAHGLLDGDDPMYSRLLLSGAEKHVRGDASGPPATPSATDEDGLLEAWEIMDLKLKASLVVLSACETARGRVGDGEGIVGFTWALFIAGVPSTVVSQWKVDEEATVKLMYFFHENLVRGKKADPVHPRKAEALRQASLKLIGSEKYGHPYYWAGFVLVGDGT